MLPLGVVLVGIGQVPEDGEAFFERGQRAS